MARTVKPEVYAARRDEILDAALRQMMAKGYGGLVIQDILKEINISSGAFHHYFESRDALLEALILRISHNTEKLLLPIIHDPRLSAIQKLQAFFGTLDNTRVAHKADVIRMQRVWYGDDNAVVRLKMDAAMLEQRAPLLTAIVRQGIQEGVFSTAYPDQAGKIILSLHQGMGNIHAGLLLEIAQRFETSTAGGVVNEERIRAIVDCIVTTHAAYMDAIERVVCAPANSLVRTNAGAVMVWVTALYEYR